ncbi:ABC transporter ATP-binding protein (plasmid) [Salinigranum rubrum]|uniref:ABC transporter ATP-binding protein n=1 Tax=Salinigranum rubrum TaxID=755307 RepID=A0A2I8VSG2_9EURY|nr:ABC transporter ATP-binding protein [Salinigranum rubrum]AUV84139.1 ABC transporter ATP-binding protein [Salinigranum rubrum]
MSTRKSTDLSRRRKLSALLDIARYNPRLTTLIVVLGIVAAILEGVGLSFILPIIELIQAEAPAQNADGLLRVFINAYQIVGIPFTLEFIVLGVAAIMTIRYTMTFVVAWLREALRNYYIRDLQIRAFEETLGVEIDYFDEEGSDDILNALITQTYYAGNSIVHAVNLLQLLFLSLVYFVVALTLAPILTLVAVCILGGITLLLRFIIEPGYEIGNRVAKANERRQEAAQAGTQGIRDVRIFGLGNELRTDFIEAVEQYTTAQISLRRNEAAIDNFYNYAVAIFIFVLIYLAFTFAELSFGQLGLFLIAMFRLGPKVSAVNQKFYQVENNLPHLIRTNEFIEELESNQEKNTPVREVPSQINRVTFDDVTFSYADDEMVLRGIDFEVTKGEFVAFVGQSGAGKSTIVALLARLYEVDGGEIRANDIPLNEMDVKEWRERIAVVRQNPFIFNDTLRYNLTVGKRNASKEDLNRVCQIAQVDEFLCDLPEGYDTILGDEGVRLSGGQKQRLALARALLKDADLLLLDEATSDLDSNLEREVQTGIESMERDYAIIAIAHRLSTIENADHIYTVEDGLITERGDHDDLVRNEGKYAEMYEVQSKSSS